MERLRPDTQMKNNGLKLSTPSDNSAFAQNYGDFGRAWAVKYKGNESAKPSLNDLINGLMHWLTRQIEQTMSNASSKNQQIKIIRNSRRNF